jgi:DNA-binding protein H-NS
MDERKRDSMIAYLRHRMEDFGISPDDLATALAAVPEAERYRSANGDSWSGEGAMPQWLKPSQAGADWTNDPFAGSPLARPSPR